MGIQTKSHWSQVSAYGIHSLSVPKSSTSSTALVAKKLHYSLGSKKTVPLTYASLDLPILITRNLEESTQQRDCKQHADVSQVNFNSIKVKNNRVWANLNQNVIIKQMCDLHKATYCYCQKTYVFINTAPNELDIHK